MPRVPEGGHHRGFRAGLPPGTHGGGKAPASPGPAVYDMVRCVDSEPGRCVHLGMTSRGTPVDITEDVAAADVRICTGNIEFHYFAGYSGGAKALMPGVSTPEAIQQNHRMMIDPAACAGNLEENPLRQDIEEAGRIADVDYIVNVILDEHKRIVHAVAGDKIAAHRPGALIWIGCTVSPFQSGLILSWFPRAAPPRT